MLILSDPFFGRTKCIRFYYGSALSSGLVLLSFSKSQKLPVRAVRNGLVYFVWYGGPLGRYHSVRYGLPLVWYCKAQAKVISIRVGRVVSPTPSPTGLEPEFWKIVADSPLPPPTTTKKMKNCQYVVWWSLPILVAQATSLPSVLNQS